MTISLSGIEEQIFRQDKQLESTVCPENTNGVDIDSALCDGDASWGKLQGQSACYSFPHSRACKDVCVQFTV